MPASIPRVVWLLGLVSLLMDLSSEMIHSLLPIYLLSVLGASTLSLGLVEGAAEATALISKVFSGTLSDRFARRKPLVVLGYGLAAITKPLFPLANSVGLVFCARFFDRIGKGIRGSPRDALLADAAPPDVRGGAYGLRQSLDTAGALLGPLLAIALMYAFSDEIRTVFWIAVIPAFLAVALLVIGVREPHKHKQPSGRNPSLNWRSLNQFGKGFWIITVIGAVVTMARFSEAFLVLRASDAGLRIAWTPLALVVMNATYVLSAYPAGRVSDRIDRVWLLVAGLVVLIVADVALALGQNVATVLIGVAIWGLHMGLTQGVFAALVADNAPAELRGSAFGIFNFLSGLVALVSSVLAGLLWQVYSPAATFLAGTVFAAAALTALLGWRAGRIFGFRTNGTNG
jgi:MFS family permease